MIECGDTGVVESMYLGTGVLTRILPLQRMIIDSANRPDESVNPMAKQNQGGTVVSSRRPTGHAQISCLSETRSLVLMMTTSSSSRYVDQYIDRPPVTCTAFANRHKTPILRRRPDVQLGSGCECGPAQRTRHK